MLTNLLQTDLKYTMDTSSHGLIGLYKKRTDIQSYFLSRVLFYGIVDVEVK